MAAVRLFQRAQSYVGYPTQHGLGVKSLFHMSIATYGVKSSPGMLCIWGGTVEVNVQAYQIKI